MPIPGFISSKLVTLRKSIERIRKKRPQLFDKMATAGSFFFTLLSTFIPLIKWRVGYIVLSLMVVSTFLYLFQWATLVNREERTIIELKKVNKKRLRQLEKRYNKKLDDEKEFEKALLAFVHSTSLQVKNFNSELAFDTNTDIINRISSFLTICNNTLEDILTIIYGKEICVSVKFASSSTGFKTYARGQNNVKSRGGKAKSRNSYISEIQIIDNYAYQLICNEKWPYFSSGDLNHLNKSCRREKGDTFYCEHGEAWHDYFTSTIIVPMETQPQHGNNLLRNFNVYGLICVDSKEIIEEWSSDSVKESIGFQLIANYADSICQLAKKYSELGG